MKQATAQSNIATTPDKPSSAVGLPAAQSQQYVEAASRYAAEWAHEMDEKGEAHSFWDNFLQIFQIRRRQFASWHRVFPLKRWFKSPT